jgi:hypothetical protein
MVKGIQSVATESMGDRRRKWPVTMLGAASAVNRGGA